MSFIPRHPQTQDVMCRHDAVTGTAAAGSVVYLSGDLKVAKVTTASGNVPFGFLGQNVRGQNAGLPENFQFPGQLGSADALLGDPVLVFHGGQHSTTNYILPTGCLAGAELYALVGNADNNGKLTSVAASGAFDSDGSTRKKVAIAENALTSGDSAAGKQLVVKILI